jgi:hypothetical protein
MSARGDSHVASEPVVAHSPGAVGLPPPNIVIDALPRRDVMWPHEPGTTTAEDVEDALQDGALAVIFRMPARRGAGDRGGDQRPLLVGQSTGRGFANIGWHRSHDTGPSTRVGKEWGSIINFLLPAEPIVSCRTNFQTPSQIDALSLAVYVILYVAFDKTFFLELLETVGGAAITRISRDV